MNPLQYKPTVYVCNDPIDEKDEALFTYLQNNKNASKDTVQQRFGDLSRRNKDHESLAHIALKCNRVAAAGWLIKNVVDDFRDQSKVAVSEEKGPYPTNSVLGYISSYCPAAIRYCPSFLFFDTPFENKTDNEISIQLVSMSDKARIDFAEKYGYALSALELDGMPLLDNMVKSGTWDMAKFLIRRGARVNQDTHEIYKKSPKKDEEFYREYLCNPLAKTLVYDDLVEKRADEFTRHIHVYSGNLNDRVKVQGKPSELFFMLVLRSQNEQILKAFLDFAERTARDLGIQAGSAEAQEAVVLADRYSPKIRERVNKIVQGKTFLGMDEAEQEAYLERYGTGELFNGKKSLLEERVERGDFKMAALLIEHGAKVDASVMVAYANSPKKEAKFYEKYLADPLAQTRVYQSLTAHDIQAFCAHMAHYCGDLNIQLKSTTSPAPFFLLVLKEDNPLMLGAFLRRAKELNQKINVALGSAEMKEVETHLIQFSNEYQAEVRSALGIIEISLPFFLLVLREKNPGKLEEFIRKANRSSLKIKVSAESQEMREIQTLLKSFSKDLQTQGTSIVEIVVKPLSASDRSFTPRRTSSLGNDKTPRASSASGGKLSLERANSSQAATSSGHLTPKRVSTLGGSSKLPNGNVSLLSDSTEKVSSVSTVTTPKISKNEVLIVLKEFWDMLFTTASEIPEDLSLSMYNYSKNVFFDAPDLKQLDKGTQGNSSEWLQNGEAYLMWIDFMDRLETIEETEIEATINTILNVKSKNGQYLVHLLLANLDIPGLMLLGGLCGDALLESNSQNQTPLEYCKSLPLIRRTQTQLDKSTSDSKLERRPSTPRSALGSPRLEALRNNQAGVGRNSKPYVLYQNLESVLKVFREFPQWKEEDQINYLRSKGLDHLQIGEQSLLCEMIGRKRWAAAKLLVTYGAKIDAKVLETYDKVKKENPNFKTDVLDSASANSKLVKHLELKNTHKILQYIQLFQRDFCEYVTLDKVTAPLYLFLLRLEDSAIGKKLAERVKALHQSIEVVEETGLAYEVNQLREKYAKELPVQLKPKPSIPVIDLSRVSQE